MKSYFKNVLMALGITTIATIHIIVCILYYNFAGWLAVAFIICATIFCPALIALHSKFIKTNRTKGNVILTAEQYELLLKKVSESETILDRMSKKIDTSINDIDKESHGLNTFTYFNIEEL